MKMAINQKEITVLLKLWNGAVLSAREVKSATVQSLIAKELIRLGGVAFYVRTAKGSKLLDTLYTLKNLGMIEAFDGEAQ